jgi:tetratricopeptide (TPR) repeat protein
VVQETIAKAKRAAIRRQWDEADNYLRAALLQANADTLKELGELMELLATDCQSLQLDDLMVWATEWVVQLQPQRVGAYLRLGLHYARHGQYQTGLEWLKRGLEMVEAGGPDEMLLQRTYRRLLRRSNPY